jgi:hypothetical protein
MSNSFDSFWDNPATYSQWNDPDGEMARRYHEVHGEWPKGSRQRWEQDSRDEAERRGPFRRDAHPGFDYLGSQVIARLRQGKLGARQQISRHVIESMRADVQPVIDIIADDVLFFFEARVLREDLPPERIEASTVVEASPTCPRPATWRDHWKLTHGHRWPVRWWVCRHPARIVEVPLTVRWKVRHAVSGDRFRLYPHADIRVRDTLGAGYLNVPIRNTITFAWLNEDEVTSW